MSPLFVNVEGRGRHAPADRIAELRDLAQCVEYYLDHHTEQLGFGEHADLDELRIRLAAYADLLAADDLERFLGEALAAAGEHFGYVKTRAIA